MDRSIPKVRNGFLQQESVEATSSHTICIGTAAWYSWLEQHSSFTFETPHAAFTARKEQRPGGWYWYAYRRSQGKLHSRYLGKSADLTLERLNETAAVFEREGEAVEGKTPRPLRMSGDTVTLAASRALRSAEPQEYIEAPARSEALEGEHHMSQQNASLVQSLYEAFARGDIPVTLEAMNPNIEMDEPQAPGYPFGGVHRGLQGLVNEEFGAVSPSYQEFAVVPLELIDVGDRVITIGECRGKGKASGTPFIARFIHIWTIRDGKVVRIEAYPDTGTMAAATR